MKSLVVKHSVVIAGYKTSVSLEDAFWRGLKDIARGRDMTLPDMVTTINSQRKHDNLSSAIRLFALDHYRRQAVPLLRKRRSAKGRSMAVTEFHRDDDISTISRRRAVKGIARSIASLGAEGPKKWENSTTQSLENSLTRPNGPFKHLGSTLK
jgi:predicted DNA-binding ribbon-helix-helix protein